MPARHDLPEPWKEISGSEPLEKAFALLQGTFPYRYLHLRTDKLPDKMNFTRDVPSIVYPNQQVSVSSLRIFTWPNKNAPKIATFFFLRFLYNPRSYCLSVGIDTSITSGEDLHDELVNIVRYMQREDGVRTIDVVNQRLIVQSNPSPGEDDLNDTPGRSTVVRDAFFDAIGDATLSNNPTDIKPGGAWPSRLKRWQVN